MASFAVLLLFIPLALTAEDDFEPSIVHGQKPYVDHELTLSSSMHAPTLDRRPRRSRVYLLAVPFPRAIETIRKDLDEKGFTSREAPFFCASHEDAKVEIYVLSDQKGSTIVRIDRLRSSTPYESAADWISQRLSRLKGP